MCNSIKSERGAQAVLQATHDVVVHVPGGSRHAPCGRKIKPMTPGVAAEATGHTEKHIRNCIDPNQKAHQLSLRAWVLMLMDEMDTLPLEALCRQLNGVFCKNIDIEVDGVSPEKSLGQLLKELGDMSAVAAKNCEEHGPCGEKWSPREQDAFDRELDDVLVAIMIYKQVAHATHDHKGVA